MEHDEHLTADIGNATGSPAAPAQDFDASHAAEAPCHAADAPERRCVLTQAHGPRAMLIRLAIGPDAQIAPDFAGKLPGRGAWISADRALLETAMAKGKLKGALARAFKSNSLRLPDDLADQIAAGLERRALDRLGLENRAGNLIWGHERIGEALLKGKVRLLLHAADARPDGMGKLEARRRGASPATPSLVLPVGREQLSMALGRENVVHAALTEAASAARVIETLTRWCAYTGMALAKDGPAPDDDNNRDTTVMAVAVAATERH